MSMVLIDKKAMIRKAQEIIGYEAGYKAWAILEAIREMPPVHQEPIRPEKGYSGSGVTWWNICGNCKTAINPNDKYCHYCGRAVKWD